MTVNLIDYEGKIALTWGWETNQDKPLEERYIWVSNIRSDNYPLVIDQPCINFSGNTFNVICKQTYQYLRFDSTGWKHTVETRPIKKPNPGHNQKYGQYDWEWCLGKWIRKLI